MGEQIEEAFLTNVADILEQARQNAKAAIDLSMVYAYFEIGKLIVEEEQSGGQRAAYGKYVIPELSKYLTAHLGRGFSVTNLKQMRKFYQVYAGDQIGQTLSNQFSNLYVNYYDRYEKTADENPTIGVLLCQQKSDALVELTLPADSNIYASKYELYLPDKKELQEKLREWIAEETGGEEP